MPNLVRVGDRNEELIPMMDHPLLAFLAQEGIFCPDGGLSVEVVVDETTYNSETVTLKITHDCVQFKCKTSRTKAVPLIFMLAGLSWGCAYMDSVLASYLVLGVVNSKNFTAIGNWGKEILGKLNLPYQVVRLPVGWTLVSKDADALSDFEAFQLRNRFMFEFLAEFEPERLSSGQGIDWINLSGISYLATDRAAWVGRYQQGDDYIYFSLTDHNKEVFESYLKGIICHGLSQLANGLKFQRFALPDIKDGIVTGLPLLEGEET